VEEYRLRNGTVCTILAIGEEAVEESRLQVLEARVADILGLGKSDEPFPYMNERLAAALRMPGPLAIQNGNVYILTEKERKLYYALLDLIYGVWGREVARKVIDVRKSNRSRRRRSKALGQEAIQLAALDYQSV
jgi:uncharacterized protein YbjT (DUF2867 family)